MYKVKDWERWQSYRNDRGQPPWIKLHRCLMRNPEWVSLTDAERGQLVAMWLLAADKEGELPDSNTIKKMCFMTNHLNINKFIELGFIIAMLTPNGSQGDQPEKRREEKNRIDKTRIDSIVEDLNLVLGTAYKTTSLKTIELISARLKEGFTVSDFESVHRKMLFSWGMDNKMVKFLRPETLYGNKFESYLNMKKPQTMLSNKSADTFLIGKEWIKKEVENVEQKQIS